MWGFAFSAHIVTIGTYHLHNIVILKVLIRSTHSDILLGIVHCPTFFT